VESLSCQLQFILRFGRRDLHTCEAGRQSSESIGQPPGLKIVLP
jgi:hypothetical protein